MAIDNQEEVAVARFAQQKAKNDDVKEFAQMLIKDHQDFLQKLAQFSPDATQDSSLKDAGERTTENRTGNATSQTQRNANQRQTTTQNTQPRRVGEPSDKGLAKPNIIERTAAKPSLDTADSSQMLSLHREIAQQCLADTKNMLNEKSEDEFDTCFVGLQIANHATMLTKLKVLQRHANNSELKDLLSKGADTTKEHMQHAEKLMDQLADAHHGDQKSNRKNSSGQESRDK